MNTPAALKEALLQRLLPFGQEGVLGYWDQLSSVEQTVLSEQLQQVDLDQLRQLVEHTGAAEDWAAVAARAESVEAVRMHARNPLGSPDEALHRGGEAIRAGEVGALLVAGGQGTRLGFEQPKGMFPLGAVSGNSLFQILIEKLRSIMHRYGGNVPLYVMTSHATHEAIVRFFHEHRRFGLLEGDVKFFCQGFMPVVDQATGKLQLQEKGTLATSPDGHGGVLPALVGSGLPADMQSRNLRDVFYFQVDNPLVRVCDPRMIGYHRLAEAEITTKVIAKKSPTEKKGNVTVVDGKTRMIEYSDLPAELADRCGHDDAPVFWNGSIAVHVFDREFLTRMASGEQLPFHRAVKQVQCVDPQSAEGQTHSIAAIKFERFIFDVFPHAKRVLVVETDDNEYASLKDSQGPHSPEAVRQRLSEQFARWIRAAGGQVDDSVAVEISPLFALDQTEAKREIQSTVHIREPRHFPPPERR